METKQMKYPTLCYACYKAISARTMSAFSIRAECSRCGRLADLAITASPHKNPPRTYTIELRDWFDDDSGE